MRALYQKEKIESTYNIMYVPYVLLIQYIFRSFSHIVEFLTLQDSQPH